MRRGKWHLVRSLLAWWVSIGLPVAGSAALTAGASYALPRWLVVGLILYFPPVLWLLVEYRRREGGLRSVLGRAADVRLRPLLKYTALLFAMSMAGGMAVPIIIHSVDAQLGNEFAAFVEDLTSRLDSVSVWKLYVGAVVIGPVAEELIFRVAILVALARALQWRAAVIITSLLFAGLHIDILGTFLFGMTLALLYLRSSRNVYGVMIVHGLHNSVALLLNDVLGETVANEYLSPSRLISLDGVWKGGIVLTYFALAILVAVACHRLWKELPAKPGQRDAIRAS